MQTLHEYMMATKAVEYVLSVVFLAAFAVFWRCLRPGDERDSTSEEGND